MTKRTPIRPRLRGIALAGVALVGAVLGTAWDRLHVAAGTASYPGTELGQPWWVPAEFGVAAVVIVLGVLRFGDPAPGRGAARRFGIEVVWFTAMYVVTAALWETTVVCVLALSVLLLVRWPSWFSVARANALPAAMLVVTGCFVEAALIAADAFTYTDRATIPLWLPVLYVHAVPLAVRGAELAVRLGGVRRPPEEPQRATES